MIPEPGHIEFEIDHLIAKSHVKGYSRKDGVYVKPHNRAGEAHHPDAVHHPKIGENGKPVTIKQPHHPSSHSTWHNPDAVATFVPGGDIPMSLNGVRISPWRDHPRTTEGWDYVDGVNEDIYEPPLHVPPGKNVSSGVVIEEPDGRVWIMSPTNQYGGYRQSFPKGTEEPELSLQANSIKEAFEETGLKVEITGFLGDYDRTTSVCRMYRAKRVGGDPTQGGWEVQAVHLCPKGLLYEHLNMWSDHGIAEDIGAGPKPAPKKSRNISQDTQKTMF